MEFKDKIKTRRAELNLTLEEVAKKVGVSAPTIQRYESGEIKNVRRDKIKLLADALQVTPGYLMGWDEKNSTEDNDSNKENDNYNNKNKHNEKDIYTKNTINNNLELKDDHDNYEITTLAAHISGAMGLTKEDAERVIEIAKMFKKSK